MLKRREISNSRSSIVPKEISLSGRSKIGSHTVRTADSISSTRVSARHPAGLHVQHAPRAGSRGRTPRGNSPPGSAGRADRACPRCRSRPRRSADCAGSSTSTKMLPGCMSAWKKLWRNTWVKKISTPFSRQLAGCRCRPRAARHVADRHAVDALHHHHVDAAVVPVHLGHVEQRRAGEVALQLRGVGGLAHQVELVENGLLVLARPSRAAAAAGLRASSAARARASAYSTSRSRSMTARMPGRSTLTTTSWPFSSRRRVHLRDRGRGQRRLVEAREHLAERACRRRARPCSRAIRAGNGGTRSCSLASSSAMSAGSRSRRVDTRLAELHEDRAELLQRQPQPLAARRASRRRSNQMPGER